MLPAEKGKGVKDIANKKIESPAALEVLLDEFIEKCKTGEIRKPTDYNLVEFLGVSVSTLERMRKGDDDKEGEEGSYKGFGEVLKKLTLFREDFYLNQGDTMAVFALKQKHNGGYTDRQKEDNTPQHINVTINGAGINPFG